MVYLLCINFRVEKHASLPEFSYQITSRVTHERTFRLSMSGNRELSTHSNNLLIFIFSDTLNEFKQKTENTRLTIIWYFFHFLNHIKSQLQFYAYLKHENFTSWIKIECIILSRRLRTDWEVYSEANVENIKHSEKKESAPQAVLTDRLFHSY